MESEPPEPDADLLQKQNALQEKREQCILDIRTASRGSYAKCLQDRRLTLGFGYVEQLCGLPATTKLLLLELAKISKQLLAGENSAKNIQETSMNRHF